MIEYMSIVCNNKRLKEALVKYIVVEPHSGIRHDYKQEVPVWDELQVLSSIKSKVQYRAYK